MLSGIIPHCLITLRINLSKEKNETRDFSACCTAINSTCGDDDDNDDDEWREKSKQNGNRKYPMSGLGP